MSRNCAALRGVVYACVEPRPAVPMLRPPRVLVQLVAAVSCLGLPNATSAVAASGEVPAYEVEAEFIERFTRFIDWPDSAFGTPDSPFVVCAWGDGPLATQLERTMSSRRVKTRPVRVVRVGSIDKLAACHVLYLAVQDREVVRSVSAHGYGKPLLSVGDQPGLAEAGLLINLVVDDDGYVRFEINRDVAKASGLKISAKLMRLARLVGGHK